jgi:hypothetical protein
MKKERKLLDVDYDPKIQFDEGLLKNSIIKWMERGNMIHINKDVNNTSNNTGDILLKINKILSCDACFISINSSYYNNLLSSLTKELFEPATDLFMLKNNIVGYLKRHDNISIPLKIDSSLKNNVMIAGFNI